MHQKKSEVQIGKESVGVSSDFNPTPPIQQNHQRHQHLCPRHHSIDIYPPQKHHHHHQPPPTKPPSSFKQPQTTTTPFFSLTVASSAAAFRILRRLKKHRSFLLISLPLLYLYLHASRSFFLDFLTALAFSTALLFSLNIALPSLRSFPLHHLNLHKIRSSSSRNPPALPVFWTIGSRPKSEKRLGSGCWVQVFGNGDVYEGEFHKGKCSGSGVYYYSMSGRYEGDWIDGRYDGYGVETWARGSRYRGQYRQGLRHGFGVYRFYTGDVYTGEWSNGQSHGCGVHTCEDGSRYVGEFKWGVKHGLGHYHFRFVFVVVVSIFDE
ncbi:phosphatidylinositol-4-phosphate 5-kinase 5-like protein [Trifolium pratense]|uniref:Phosphatidylinositol-4-phosphate 5-kinase 5-like protein n=1 Tax=Trifolium pratense TaxID=57577 RepID=A0A2K3L447_TRIPR|nr:phosphatidylinositol-4-phosphate 5-kinase 5-like protein [Trifolium pratense]